MRLPGNISDNLHVADEGDEVQADQQVVKLPSSGAGLACAVVARLYDAKPHRIQ